MKPAMPESWIELRRPETAVVATHEGPVFGPGFDEGIKTL
jgi:hypothetical protein